MRTRAALLCCLLAGCTEIGPEGPLLPDPGPGTGDPGPGSDPGSDPTTDEGRQIPTNGLQLDEALLAHLRPDPLSAAWVDDLIALPGGLELLDYVAACALAPDQELAGYPGYYGLAPEWLDGACGGGCQRWVSACLLAHANAFSAPVAISPRGAHPGLAAPDPRFDYQEAAYYGNVFGGDPSSLQMYACAGRGLLDAQADGDYYLRGRICGVTGACGLVNTGLCASPVAGTIDVPGIAACEVDGGESGAYRDCHVGGQAETLPRLSPVVAEVITVYLGP